ncbi:MAG TPA: hypothetical protein VFO89_07785, partial [Thermoanaerobaculia bacterium]|nr:hypothetical protein [Thermoanaerobaculia bacterium]
MKRTLVSLALLAAGAALATPVLAQQTAAPAAAAAGSSDSKKIVAVVNGEAITSEKLDGLWERMSPKMRLEYERNGG